MIKQESYWFQIRITQSEMIKLSIIIPYYNAKQYTDELLNCLLPQLTDEVEVILVDDGSDIPFKTNYQWCRVFRKENGGCSSARNMGLDNSVGEYIQFVDADDLVADDFISKILSKIEEHPDIIEYSWKSLSAEGPQHDHKLEKDTDRLSNPSVCTRTFSRKLIGNIRFNEKKDSTEDEDFSRKIGYLGNDNLKISIIKDYMYFYRTAVTNSKVKRFKMGLMNAKRIVYYYDHVTNDMAWLLDEIKKEDETNEVWLLTNQNDIPELKRYCQISKPIRIWGHAFRGESYSKFTLINPPIKKQIVFYCSYANKIGGISTFLYNTCKHLKEYYDIMILYDDFHESQIEKLGSVCDIMKNDAEKIISCNTLVLNRINEKIPENVVCKKTVQVCHACKQKIMTIPHDRDYLVNVSQAAKDSWGNAAQNGIVIHNMSYPEPETTLLIVSATRMKVSDKGLNDNRTRKLAEMLNEKDIPFIWLNFSDKGLDNPPKNFINMDPRLNIQGFIEKADYLVQLSDQEAYSMSILEALCLNTAVVATPFPSLFEEGVVDGVNGYVVPFDMDFDVTKLLEVPKFKFKYDNKKIIKQWQKLFELPKPEKKEDELIRVKVIKKFKDVHTGKVIDVGEAVLSRKRVSEILETQREKKVTLIKILEG